MRAMAFAITRPQTSCWIWTNMLDSALHCTTRLDEATGGNRRPTEAWTTNHLWASCVDRASEKQSQVAEEPVQVVPTT